MALYELRTYTFNEGKMNEGVALYKDVGFPAVQKGGHDRYLLGYFLSESGSIGQLVHLWKFTDDAERKAHWAAVVADKNFMDTFAAKFRPMLSGQESKLLTAAPWGPHP